jgi:hypothetical protein
MLNLVVHTVTTGFKGLSYFFFLSEWPSHNFEANAQLSGQETLFQWNSNFRHMSQMNAAHSLSPLTPQYALQYYPPIYP